MPIVTVFGASNCPPDSQPYATAEHIGRLLGEAGYSVMTGGYFGMMEAVSKGAKSAGARVVGVTVAIFEGEGKRPGPNAYNDEVIKYDNLRDRLYHLVSRCDAAVALPGGIGTMSEVALTWSLLQVNEINPIPFVVYGEAWKRMLETLFDTGQYVDAKHMSLWRAAHTPDEVITLLKSWTHA